MAKVKGQMVPPELREKYYRIFETNSNSIVSTRQNRSPQSTEKQKRYRENFIRCTLYWNNLEEDEKADIFNQAQGKGMRYFNFFMNEVLKKRHKGDIPYYGLKINTYPSPCPSPAGITILNDNIIVADGLDSKLYQIDDKLQLINIIELPEITPRGLTAFKDYLWITDGSETIYQMGLDGTIESPFYLENRHLEAIAADKKQLLCYDTSGEEVISYMPTSGLTETKYQVGEQTILGLGWDEVYLWASTSQSIDMKDVNFNMEEYLPGIGNEEDFELEQVKKEKFSLNRFAAKNSANSLFDLSITNLDIQLSYFSFQGNLIWAADPENGLIHKIRVVADLP